MRVLVGVHRVFNANLLEANVRLSSEEVGGAEWQEATTSSNSQ